MGLTIVPPEGIPEPKVTENFGNTTTVNNDAHVRVWVVQVLAEGTYDITTDGKVNGYINPRLAFGHDASFGWLAWAFAGLFVLGLVELTASIVYAVRSRPPPTALSQQPIDIGDSSRVDSSSDVSEPSTPDVSDPYTPTDDGIRFEALRNLKALRDSGALTEDEFKAEKRRILKD